MIRDGIGAIYPENSLYTTLLSENSQIENTDLFGFNCYIPDWSIPGHPSQLEHTKQSNENLIIT